MGEYTAIGWTDKTYNPWIGCARISPGCDECYMFEEQIRYGHDPACIHRTSPATFNAPLKWKSGRVFTCSWSDFFIAEADAWRPDAWEVIRRTPHLTYQILTKRPALIARRLPNDWGNGWAHVWLGVSVESRKYLSRIDGLRETPAALRFLSLEPLLEDLGTIDLTGISWVIIGGESGPKARPCDPEWVMNLVCQCEEADVPVFVKQGSARRSGQQANLPDNLWSLKQIPNGGER